jgi:hypothetical protein
VRGAHRRPVAGCRRRVVVEDKPGQERVDGGGARASVGEEEAGGPGEVRGILVLAVHDHDRELGRRSVRSYPPGEGGNPSVCGTECALGCSDAPGVNVCTICVPAAAALNNVDVDVGEAGLVYASTCPAAYFRRRFGWGWGWGCVACAGVDGAGLSMSAGCSHCLWRVACSADTMVSFCCSAVVRCPGGWDGRTDKHVPLLRSRHVGGCRQTRRERTNHSADQPGGSCLFDDIPLRPRARCAANGRLMVVVESKINKAHVVPGIGDDTRRWDRSSAYILDSICEQVIFFSTINAAMSILA